MATAPEFPPASPTSPPPCLFLAGPTAVGKSDAALRLAGHLDGEIISVDSMQVYRGLDVGTAKPSPADRARVPHHLIDICDLDESFDAAQFVRRARQAVSEIQSRRRVPIFCGGTGLYFKAYLSGLGEAPPANPDLRAELEALPFETLLRELQERDPAAYEKIDKENPRRVIRALEVIRLTGRTFSSQRAEWKSAALTEDGRLKMEDGKPGQAPSSIPPPPPPPFICLTRSAADLRVRINSRVDEMFRRGLVEETRALLQRGLERNRTAMQAIGYRQVVEHLRGERGLAETVERVRQRTRQFAKRQLTWFRRYGNAEWIELKAGDSAEDAADALRVRFGF